MNVCVAYSPAVVSSSSAVSNISYIRCIYGTTETAGMMIVTPAILAGLGVTFNEFINGYQQFFVQEVTGVKTLRACSTRVAPVSTDLLTTVNLRRILSESTSYPKTWERVAPVVNLKTL